MVTAYGGEERWRNATSVDVELDAGGLLFRWKRGRKYPQLKVRAAAHEPSIRMEPFERPELVGILEGHDVRLETTDGRIVESRANARTRFPYGRQLVSWDRLDMVYFLGHALWNYFAFPALLLRDDIDWREVSDSILEASFPDEIPTHSHELQTFRFDPATSLLVEYDYTAKTFGGWAVAAHMITEHSTQAGVTFPSKRRVKPRKPYPPKYGPIPGFPDLIWADLHKHRLV